MGGCDMDKATPPWTQRVWGTRKILGSKQGNVPRGTLSKNKFGGYKYLPLSLGGI